MPLVSRLLVFLASVSVLLALLTGYARRAVMDSDQFANRATAALADEDVRNLVAQRVTDDVVLSKQGDLIAARPIIQSVASTVVGSQAFAGLFRAAVRDVHRAVFHRDRDTVTLTMSDVGSVLAGALQAVRPGLANQVRADKKVELLDEHLGSVTGDAVRVGDDVRIGFVVFGVLALLFAAGAIASAKDRRRAVSELGIGVAAAGVVLVVALAVARSYVAGAFDGEDEQAAARAVWDAFLGDLRTAAWVLAASGAIVAAAAASLIKPVDVEPALARLARWVTSEPERTWVRVARAAGFVALGVLVLANRAAVVDLLVTIAGVYLIFKGVEAILRLVYRPRAADEREERVRAGRRLRWRPSRRTAVIAIAGLLVVAGAGLFAGSGGTSTSAPPLAGCNGHEELCDRPLTAVVLPATHNAMSVPLPGWFSSEQERPIAGQLEDGVRGLLLDTHYGDKLPNGNVRTEFTSRSKLIQAARRDGVSQQTVDAALRLRDRLGFRGKGKRGMFLCHTFCELGYTPLSESLTQVHDFLAADRGAVVVVVNEDYVTPKDFVGAVKAAGLEEFVYRGPTSGSWPTLGHMVETNQRLVLLGEDKAGAAPWYHPAFQSIVQDTPYTFKSAALLTTPKDLPASCEPNRGEANAPTLLVNHWVSTDPLPRPSDARRVNAYAPLLRRARECARLRHRSPNLLAVNFYREGDLFRVVDTLNGVG
jgi:hypothetical protein